MKTIPDDVIRVLDASITDGNTFRLPPGQLDRKLYVAVNKVLEAAGGKWNKKAGCHLFPGDAADALEPIILTGEYATPKQDFGQFDTPSEVAAAVIAEAKIEKGMIVLEPSAGKGALVQPATRAGADVHAIELDPGRVLHLERESVDFALTVIRADFLECKPQNVMGVRPDGNGVFDRVVMNPPFAKGADISHVRHAYDFLRPGGRLVAIMSTGWTFRKDREFREFREWAMNIWDQQGGCGVPNAKALPDGAFKESGTNVSTIMVTLDKPE